MLAKRYLSFGILSLSKRKWPMDYRCRMLANDTVVTDNVSVTTATNAEIISQSNVVEPLIVKISQERMSNIRSNATPIREVWIENMSTPHSIKLGMMQLQPEIFSAFPQPDLINENQRWQTLYKHVDWRFLRNRAELSGSGRKPWPQKGTGRARHGSRRAPMWVGGGWACGPRGPKTYFFMLPHHKRVNGLIATLSAKFSQNDLYVVDTFETFPADGTGAHLEELCEARGWGPSVLFVDKMDLEQYPKATDAQHLYEATMAINHINVIPVYSLNVFSMLKHETLVLTVDALNEIQERLLFNLKRIDLRRVVHKYKPNPISNM